MSHKVLVIRNVEVDGQSNRDVLIRDGKVQQIEPSLQIDGDVRSLDGRGGALLPGLHDHHLHIFALAAQAKSLDCVAEGIANATDLARYFAGMPGTGWLRVVGYHEHIAGELSRERLDELCRNRPIRVQHRTGQMWAFNSIACEILDISKRSNGQVYRGDRWLRGKLPSVVDSRHDLPGISAKLATYGVTHVTDATPSNTEATREQLEQHLPHQHVHLMGDVDLASGERKLLLDEARLPDLDEFCESIRHAHSRSRPVAIHCVTRTELVFALAAIRDAGVFVGDRIEHASVTDEACLEQLAELGIKVVTQHNFLGERGDDYIRDVSREQRGWLYRGRSFLDRGIELRGGTDAPFGDADPWCAIRDGVWRRTAAGELLNPAEALRPLEAFGLFTSRDIDANDFIGSDANLCVLTVPWQQQAASLTSANVALTIKSGSVTYERGAMT